MRKVLRASALVLALCCPVYAGDMSCPPVATPPPTLAADGTIHTGAADSMSEVTVLTGITLDLLQSVLSLF